MIQEVTPRVVLIAQTNELMLPAKAARFCTSSSSIEQIMADCDRDDAVLDNVLKLGHTSVLEHLNFTFGISGVSRVTEVQMVRHRIASFSVKSGRYTKVKEKYEAVIPEKVKAFKTSLGEAKTLRGVDFSYGTAEDLIALCHRFYLNAISAGIPAEDARYILPQATATQFMVTMNARELLHFFRLRCCGKAQWEIREVANRMLDICKEIHPAIFLDAGPQCLSQGFCREKQPCMASKAE